MPINQFRPNPTVPVAEAIGTVANALAAAKNYYGIDTEHQAARLAKLDADEAQAASEGHPGIRTFLKNGYMFPTGSVPGSAPQTGQTPQMLSVSNATPTPSAAQNDSPTNDAGSIMPKQPIQKISDFVKPSRPAQSVQGMQGSPLGGMINVALPSGDSVAMIPNLAHQKDMAALQNELLTGQKLQHERDFGDITAIRDKFNDAAKAPMETLNGHQQIQDALISGNPTAIQAAIMQFPMVWANVKRVNTEAGKGLSDPSWLAQIEKGGSESLTGNPPPQDLKNFIDANNIAMKNTGNQLNKLAQNYSGQYKAEFGGKDISNVLLPNGTGVNPVQTKVLNTKTDGTPALHINTGNGWAPAGDTNGANVYSNAEVSSGKTKGLSAKGGMQKVGNYAAGIFQQGLLTPLQKMLSKTGSIGAIPVE